MFNPYNSSNVLFDVNHYNLAFDCNNAVSIPGCKVVMDEVGRIRSAQYESGAEVKLNHTYSITKSINNQMWFGDRSGQFHPLD